MTCAAAGFLASHGTPSTPEDLARNERLDHHTQLTGRRYPWRFTVNGAVKEWPPSGRLMIDDAAA